MERFFRLENGDLVDIVDHCISEISKHNNLKVYIATDSQNGKRNTTYATAVVFRYGSRGAHYAYRVERMPKIKDLYKRLFKEGELTIGTADLITSEIPLKIEALEFDYNNMKKTLSSPLISGVGGWAESMGYNVRFKAQEMIASKAADHICRKKH